MTYGGNFTPCVANRRYAGSLDPGVITWQITETHPTRHPPTFKWRKTEQRWIVSSSDFDPGTQRQCQHGLTQHIVVLQGRSPTLPDQITDTHPISEQRDRPIPVPLARHPHQPVDLRQFYQQQRSAH